MQCRPDSVEVVAVEVVGWFLVVSTDTLQLHRLSSLTRQTKLCLRLSTLTHS
jgi:hypothetical protein